MPKLSENVCSLASPVVGNVCLKQRRALVVDDNVDAASVMAMFLDACGVDVVVEYYPVTALERAQNERFDVFVLDIGLPEIDGHELARRLRARPGNGESIFIALTGYGTEEDRRKSAAAGFHHHFVKPLNIEKFVKIFPWPSQET